MAETTKELRNKQIALTQKMNQAESVIDSNKEMAENPKLSDSDRARYRATYDKAVKDLAELKSEYKETEKNINKTLGKSEVEKLRARYDDLKKSLEIQIDPNSESAKKIESQMDKLATQFQNAYSRAVGTRVSLTVSNARLKNNDVSTLAKTETADEPTAEQPSEETKKEDLTPKIEEEKKKKSSTGDLTTPSSTDDALKKKKTKDIKLPTTEDKEIAAEKIASGADFGLSEALFKNIPGLKEIYDEYTNPKSGMTDDEFRKLIRQDTWYKQNSGEIKKRFVQFYNYEDLKNSGQAKGSTDYEKQIAKIESNLKKRAVQLGSAAASDPNALRKAAENLYLTDRSEDESFITDFLASAIRPVSGMIGGKGTEGYSGEALQNYNALLGVARNNGFKMSDIIPGGQNEQQLLGSIARGEIDINRVAQDARKLAAQGQPQYVRDLLSQGYDLAQVYSPYRQTMANILEINDPNQIDLNDQTLRMAISDKGDMNIYDFKKALKQDKRWQYTEQAREEVSNAALTVLRDFGFQG